MLILYFYLGDVMYAIKCENILEISPVVILKDVPHTPAYFSGYFNYRGNIVPVIDLCQLIQGRTCEIKLSTRIVLVDCKGENNDRHILGVMAERVTDISKKSKSAFSPPSIRSREAPYLGGIVMEEDQMIQYLELDRLPSCIDFLPMTEDGVKDESIDH